MLRVNRLTLRRIISACAEQTPPNWAALKTPRDHLRVCGADTIMDNAETIDKGSSPRVRSRRHGNGRLRRRARIISACAEQTCRRGWSGCMSRDHLRVCGADEPTRLRRAFKLGSSPRVRSRRAGDESRPQVSGIISACAEQTPRSMDCWQTRTDHLRVCGADFGGFIAAEPVVGSSPRVRSRLRSRLGQAFVHGIISACAEQTVVFYCGLGWSGVAEYLIHALRGVGKRRGCQYLE